MNAPGYANTTLARGNVEFLSDNTRLFCDSALWFHNDQVVHAYGKVQINQGDTINLFCDSLYFFGKSNFSKLMGNVRLRDSEYKLTTDSLEYDGKRAIGAYRNHAVITSIHQDLTLTSVKGYYHSKIKTFYFKDSVHVTHPEYELLSDTLEFRTHSSTALFHGKTTILLDSMNIECNKGIYDTNIGQIDLWRGATILESSRRFYADSISYNEQNDIGEGFCNVDLLDTLDNIRFLGDYLWKNAGNQDILLRDNARVFQFNDSDTLYLRADTIYHHEDTTTHFRWSKAVDNVSIISGDLLVVCDSAYFGEQDSILKLHQNPVLWNEDTQLSADSVLALYYDQEFHEMYLYENAMIITGHDDSLYFDQIKGKEMTAWLDSSKIKKVLIQSNAQTLYYTTEDKKDSLDNPYQELTGMNRIDCNEIFIYFVKAEIEKVTFIDEPTATYYPMDLIPVNELFLKGFLWQIHRKPDQDFRE